MSDIKPGTRYTKDGVSVDVHDVYQGEVYFRQWPKDVNVQAFLNNLGRMSVEEFAKRVIGATVETQPEQRNE